MYLALVLINHTLFFLNFSLNSVTFQTLDRFDVKTLNSREDQIVSLLLSAHKSYFHVFFFNAGKRFIQYLTI